jgi:hypothetical protein
MLRKTPTGTWLPAWVPESSTTLAVLLLICSTVQSATGGYDGSMLNGLNILPSYTDYFHLNAATTGLQTGSVFIGGVLGPLFTGIMCDSLGRRPTIFWGAALSLVGIVLQTAAQNIAMFTIARVILGFGTAVSGIASGVYLSETFASQYRAWGVGLLNDFCKSVSSTREAWGLHDPCSDVLMINLTMNRLCRCSHRSRNHAWDRTVAEYMGVESAISIPRHLRYHLHHYTTIHVGLPIAAGTNNQLTRQS